MNKNIKNNLLYSGLLLTLLCTFYLVNGELNYIKIIRQQIQDYQILLVLQEQPSEEEAPLKTPPSLAPLFLQQIEEISQENNIQIIKFAFLRIGEGDAIPKDELYSLEVSGSGADLLRWLEDLEDERKKPNGAGLSIEEIEIEVEEQGLMASVLITIAQN